MASNSFKVKNSLVLTPKDLSTLTNPEAGDLACDINDNNKIKRYDETLADWVEVGSGAGGGLDVFHTDSFDDIKNTSSFSTGNNASFLGGGTLAGGLSLESVSPISGINSLKYTQASGSLNDYFASEIIDVDLKQQNNTSGMTLYFTYDGDANDGRFIVWDETNDQVISNELALVETASKATRYSLSFTVPTTCTQIRWGYQVLVENVGAVLLVDDVEMSSDPFVNRELEVYESYVADGHAGYGSTNTVIPYFTNIRKNTLSKIVKIENSPISGLTITALRRCTVNADYSFDGVSGSGHIGFSLNSNQLTTSIVSISQSDRKAIARENNTTGSANASVSLELNAGDVLRPHNEGNAAGNIELCHFLLTATAQSDQLLTPSDTFSTDTAPLTYAPSSQYTLSTLENAPVGTFITFTYAANSNTRTQTTTAPSQSTSDMNQNGIQIFTRAFNAASTAASPAAIAIQIGKGLKGHQLNLYKNAGKVTSGELDRTVYGTTGAGQTGAAKSYNDNTGILILDTGYTIGGSGNVEYQFFFSDNTTQNNGYLAINAGKTLPLLAIPTPKVAYLKDVKPSGTAGGTFTSGAWQTRTLNTVEGDGSIVSLNANQFVLQPGKYEIEASAPGYKTNRHKIKLRNVTTSSDTILGSSECSPGQDDAPTSSKLKGIINVTSSQSFEIQHQCQTSRLNDGFGLESNFGVSEVYTQVKITKLS